MVRRCRYMGEARAGMEGEAPRSALANSQTIAAQRTGELVDVESVDLSVGLGVLE